MTLQNYERKGEKKKKKKKNGLVGKVGLNGDMAQLFCPPIVGLKKKRV